MTTRGVLGGWEPFHVRMDKNGRITIPKLTLKHVRSRGEIIFLETVARFLEELYDISSVKLGLFMSTGDSRMEG